MKIICTISFIWLISRMEQVLKLVDQALKEKKLSASKASMEAVGNVSLIKNMRAGQGTSFSNVEKLFAVLGINLNYSLDSDIPASPIKVPMLGYIAAGGGDDKDDTTRAFISKDDNGFDQVSAPPMLTKAGDVFCLQVRGNSMRPAYTNGCRLFFRRDDPLRNQQERLIGHNCAIRLSTNEIYVKRLARPDSGRPNEWNLESLNPVWPVMTNQEVEEALPVRYAEYKI